MAPPHLNIQISAVRFVDVIAKIVGPAWYDGPRFGRGDGPGGPFTFASDPQPVPWRITWAMLNPQPLPPRWVYAVGIADAHLAEIIALERIRTTVGGAADRQTADRLVSLVSEIEDICPRWPHWPHGWPPPPPPPPWWDKEDMTATELLVFGSRFVTGADHVGPGALQDALVSVGKKAFTLAVK